MMASAPCRNCRPFRPSRAAFASAAPSRRWSKMLPSSAITGCWMSRELMTSLPKASDGVDIDSLLVAMRPKLHRYCARMVGSVIDGEDVLQDALIKAVEAFAAAGPLRSPEAWLFRIAHNTALDFLRRRVRREALQSGEEVEMIADQFDELTSRQIAAT